jgi:hypothetical protein
MVSNMKPIHCEIYDRVLGRCRKIIWHQYKSNVINKINNQMWYQVLDQIWYQVYEDLKW